MANRFEISTIFKAIDRFSGPISRMQRRLRMFTKGATRNLGIMNRQLTNIAGGLRRVGVVAALTLGVMAAGYANVIRVGADFEQVLVNAGTRFKDQLLLGTKGFAELEATAKKFGETTEFTASQAAAALNTMAKAGFTSAGAMGALKSITNLATVAEVELAEAANISTKVLGQFGLRSDDPIQQTKNLVRVIDTLSLAANRGNTTLVDMFEALKQGAPAAKLVGADIETTTALLAKLADAGIEASRAGTGVKRISLGIQAPKSPVGVMLRRLKIQTADKSTGKFRDLLDILEDLGGALDKMGEIKAVPLIKEIFGQIGLPAAVNALAAIQNVKELRIELRKGEPVAQKWADIMRNTVSGSLKALTSVIEAVKIEIFTMNRGGIKDTIDMMVSWVRVNRVMIATKFGNFLKFIVKNLEAIAGWGVKIFKLVAVFVAVTFAVKAFNVVLAIMDTLAALNPIGLIVAGIIALTIAVGAIIIFWDDLAAGFAAMPAWLQTVLMVINPIILIFKLLTMAITAIRTEFGSLGEFFSLIGNIIANVASKIIEMVTPLFKLFAEWVQWGVDIFMTWTPLGVALKAMFAFLMPIMKEFFDFIRPELELMLGLLKRIPEAMRLLGQGDDLAVQFDPAILEAQRKNAQREAEREGVETNSESTGKVVDERLQKQQHEIRISTDRGTSAEILTNPFGALKLAVPDSGGMI